MVRIILSIPHLHRPPSSRAFDSSMVVTTTARRPTKVLVTGGNGLVGSAIQWAVVRTHPLFGCVEGEHWVFVTRDDADLRQYEQAKRLFAHHRPTHVIHLAARVGGVYANSAKPVDFLRDNLAIDQNVLRLCHEFEVEKAVSCLPTCIFPDDTTYPLYECMMHDGPPHTSVLGYAHAKRILDVSNRAYHAQYGCNFTAVIAPNVYGPYDNFSASTCALIPSVIRRVSEAKRLGMAGIQLPGSGKAVRQFIFAKDLARLIIWALRFHQGPDPIVMSVDPDQEVSVKDVVSLICELEGFRGDVVWDTTKSDGPLRKTVDNALIREELGQQLQLTPLLQGLLETLAWCRTGEADL